MMKKLPHRNQKKIKRQALRAGSRIIVKEQRKYIDQIPGDRLNESGKDRVKRAVGVVTSKSNMYEGKVFVGPRYGGVKHVAPDAHWYEFGTDDRTTDSGEFRGRMQPTPFVRPSWDSKKREAVEETRRELVERTINEAVKLRKR